MSEPKKDYAVYNLERTIVEYPFGKILENMVQVEMLPDSSRGRSVGLQRNIILGGLRGKTPKDIRPLLDLTKRQAPQQIAKWATLLMERHAHVDRTIAIFSATMPQPFVHAFAVGLRAILPPGTNTEAYGKPTVMREGHLTGELEEMLKAKTLEGFQSEGHKVSYIADSFGTNIVAVKLARTALLVNFQSDRPEDSYDHLDWAEHDQNIVHAQSAHSIDPLKYNLNITTDQTELLQWLTRNDPAAQI